MKLVILRSAKTGVEKAPDGPYQQEFNTHYADRLIGNLRGHPEFCTACANDCFHCRASYRRNHSRDIAGVFAFPAVLPYLIEKPQDYVPANVPAHDALVAVHIHEQILLAMLNHCPRWGTRCVVVPLEAPDWISRGARSKAIALCRANGVEIDFPKPLCAFKPAPGTALAEFRESFHIGCPDVALTVENGVITKADVKVAAACGSTYYIARWLVGRNLDDDLATEVISKRLHSYPCTASMERDPELADDTPLHIAGQAHNKILAPVKDVPAPSHDRVLSPTGRLVQRAPTDSLKNIRHAKELILQEHRSHGAVSFKQLQARAPNLNRAAFISAMLLLKKEGKW